LAIFDVEDYREIPYYFGVNKCWMTLKKGKVIYSRDASASDSKGGNLLS
jgi:imidazolonepropionase-like amidohydrolase